MVFLKPPSVTVSQREQSHIAVTAYDHDVFLLTSWFILTDIDNGAIYLFYNCNKNP